MSPAAQNLPKALLGRFGAKLRFPQLFTLVAGLFLLDLLIPDLIPFVDEILLGLTTLLLGSLQKSEPPKSDKPPMKDVTPADD